LYLSVNAFSCSGVPAAIGRVIVPNGAQTRTGIFMDFLMRASVVGSVSKWQGNSEKKNLC
jgi:hypothetical protein